MNSSCYFVRQNKCHEDPQRIHEEHELVLDKILSILSVFLDPDIVGIILSKNLLINESYRR